MAPTIQDVLGVLKDIKKRGFDTIVVDDFSFMAEQTFASLEKKHSGFALWGALRQVALDFRDQVRFAGIDVVLNAWEKGPKLKDGAQVRGGPLLAGNLIEAIPAMCDIVLRGCHEPARKPWPAVYRCSTDPKWVMKDRTDVATCANPAPMNLGEILRAGGREVPRHADSAEQEKEVTLISGVLTGDPVADAPNANQLYQELIAKGRKPTEARWTLRDAMDRAVIKRALARSRGSFIDMSGPLM